MVKVVDKRTTKAAVRGRLSKERQVAIMWGKYLAWAGIASSVVMQILGKFADVVLKLHEIVDVAEFCFKQIAPDLLPADFDRFGAITSQAELDSFQILDGDVLFVIPRELTDKVKIQIE